MSTKNLDKGSLGRLSLFMLLSLLIHAAAGAFLLTVGPAGRLLFHEMGMPGRAGRREPIVVDVVELPPGPKGRAPEVITRFADRSQTVKRETYPLKKPSIIIRPSGSQAKTKGGALAGPRPPRRKAEDGSEREGLKAAAALKPGDAPVAARPDIDIINEVKGDGITVQPPRPPEAASQEGPGPSGPGAGGAGGEGGEAGKPGLASRPSLILPEEKIAELERRYESEEGKGEVGKTLQLNTSELRYQKYLVNMKNKIQLYWEYPQLAARNGWEGRLQINFTIRKDGSIGDILLVKSSNYPALDDAAVTALKLASPFPPFPETFGIEQINIKGQFEYSIVYAMPQR